MFRLGDSRIRTKLYVAYAGAFLIIFLVSGVIIHAQIRTLLQENTEAELSRTTEALRTMVRATVDVSIRNYMRAVSEKCLDEARSLNRQVQRGLLTEAEAKDRAQKAFLSQSIGRTGHVYCLNSQGVMVVHPKRSLVGVDMSGMSFVREQIQRKEGYMTYEWKEPLETKKRSKAAYMTYFEPWDWIISASSYRSEFVQLVNVEDFRKRFFELRSGRSGYPFVFNYDGYLLIHPHLRGLHYHEYDSPGLSDVAERIVREKNGHFDYLWRNPGEEELKKKVVYYKDIPELHWVVASSSYYEDFQEPLDAIGYVMLMALAVAVLLMIPVSFGIGALITRPIDRLQENFARAADGDFSVRMEQHSRDELGLMAGYFNSFMERLTAYSQDLETEIAHRRKTEKELIAMDRAKSMFLASASHELRTPLTSIIGFLHLMEKQFRTRFLPVLGPLDPLGRQARQFEKNLNIVHIEADRLGRLVNDLLDLSKIEAGRMEWRDKTLSVDSVLHRAAEASRAPARDNPKVKLHVEPLSEPLAIKADEDKIHQVLINLLSNAFKNTESGSVTLSAVRVGSGVRFSVCDTGRGISEHEQERIFDIFYQGSDENNRSTRVFGTGLGLSICRKIVSHYGNQLVVDSVLGKGSCFRFTIPVARDED
ncbi:cache domain-containing protein [uncultured Pseudodesulfovibrio sp.]|uniref:cache domain-containing protein n=1 Tax=uncultured Pseudodesulfovibrio sp. TaxID=2035858 RepID=UPI0029C80796|nr:cache domain-containing protein [uncultured Pseudodesulfovibrio sp.]